MEVTRDEAAELLGVSPSAVKGILDRENISYRQVDDGLLVNLQELLAYMRSLERPRPESPGRDDNGLTLG